MRVVEVDLSSLLHAPVSLDDVRRAVVEEVERKSWVAHPGVPGAAAALLAEHRRDAELQLRAQLSREQEARALALRPPRTRPEGPVSSVVRSVLSQRDSPNEERRLFELRAKLNLPASAPWPRHLDLTIPANGGCLASPRVWLSQLFLDWVHGRSRGRFLVSDLTNSVATKFGVKSPYGRRDLARALERRVLPYWAACGFVEPQSGGVVVLTGKAAGGG